MDYPQRISTFNINYLLPLRIARLLLSQFLLKLPCSCRDHGVISPQHSRMIQGRP